MPTVLMVDVSLSMARSSFSDTGLSDEKNGGTSKKALAVRAIYKFLEYLGQHSKLEYVSLVVFSSQYETLVLFTRDYEQVKSAADNIVLYDKTNLDAAFIAVKDVIHGTFGTSISTKVILITDGLLDTAHDLQEKSSVNLPVNCELIVLCLSCTEELSSLTGYPPLKEFVDTVGGTVIIPEAPPSFAVVESLVQKLMETHYRPYSGVLHCGNLKSSIQLFPPPGTYTKANDFITEDLQFPPKLHIFGFLSIADLKSPAFVTRHLVLPLRDDNNLVDEGEEHVEDGRVPAFTVMLHGALKIESTVAMVQIREDWYGVMYSCADSKKKSNLVLLVFQPGRDSLPWLGDLGHLGPLDQMSFTGLDVPQSSSLPVPITDKKSYSSTQPSTLRQASLQSDIQKLLRYGRKLPEKQHIFYKELNRIHKLAVSMGFHQLLVGIAQILERECTQLPNTAHPDAAMQLHHAASQLKSSKVMDINFTIHSLNTNFASGD